jgi:riboflavin biosynthesis pyrimidine reductase
VKRLRDAKCEVLTLPVSTSAVAAVPFATGSRRHDDAGTRQSDANDLPGISLESLLDELGRRQMTNVLVEGGAGVLGSLFDAKLVDEVHVFVAPKLLGGTAAKGPIGGRGWPYLASAPRIEQVEVRRLGDDLYLRGRCAAAEGSEEYLA